MEPKKVWLVNDEQFGWCILGDISRLLEYLEVEIAEANLTKGKAKTFEFDIKWEMMTEAEIEAAPVV